MVLVPMMYKIRVIGMGSLERTYTEKLSLLSNMPKLKIWTSGFCVFLVVKGTKYFLLAALSIMLKIDIV